MSMASLDSLIPFTVIEQFRHLNISATDSIKRDNIRGTKTKIRGRRRHAQWRRRRLHRQRLVLDLSADFQAQLSNPHCVDYN
jgi:hypothetical protein